MPPRALRGVCARVCTRVRVCLRAVLVTLVLCEPADGVWAGVSRLSRQKNGELMQNTTTGRHIEKRQRQRYLRRCDAEELLSVIFAAQLRATSNLENSVCRPLSLSLSLSLSLCLRSAPQND